MSLFIQSLVALAASVSSAPAVPQDAALEPAAVVAVQTQADIQFAENLVSKLDSVTPRAEVNRKPIWGQTWPQTTWLEIQPFQGSAQADAPQVSAAEAFERINQ
ncbi:MAG: hypothetical protein IPK82_19615 [Polyangiaceae bacterium]|nr:hypothetical protein [Polyangiaceae bacterium]